MPAPIIGLTTYGRFETKYQTTHYAEWFAIPTLYVDAVRRAGGVPILLPPGEENWQAVLDTVDGLILIGGTDINPEYYGGAGDHPLVLKADPQRDACEINLVQKLLKEKKLPMLCICRGLQVANVALGGTLHEDIAEFLGQDLHRDPDKRWTVQSVKAQEGSLIAATMGAGEVATYSGHHQAIKDLGAGLEVTAVAPDGIIEAVELPGHPWFIAVQWHPEISAAADPTQQRLFDALVRASTSQNEF